MKMAPFFISCVKKGALGRPIWPLTFSVRVKDPLKNTKGGYAMNGETHFWSIYADDSDKAAWLSLEVLQKRQIKDAVALYGEEKVKKALKKL